jgi:hypothetical protein
MKKTVFSVALMVLVVLTSTVSAQSLSSLTTDQGALYLACYVVASGVALPADLSPNVIVAETMLNKGTISQFKKLTALRGNTLFHLGQLEDSNLKNYGCQLNGDTPGSKQRALEKFTTQNAAGCLAIASAYIPLNPYPANTPNVANFVVTSSSTSATVSGSAGAVQQAGTVTVTNYYLYENAPQTCDSATVSSISSGSFPAVTICITPNQINTVAVNFECSRLPAFFQLPE